jgi:hypothetical protein
MEDVFLSSHHKAATQIKSSSKKKIQTFSCKFEKNTDGGKKKWRT